MSTIQNLHSFNPFADASKGNDLLPAGTEDYIHIRENSTEKWQEDPYYCPRNR